MATSSANLHHIFPLTSRRPFCITFVNGWSGPSNEPASPNISTNRHLYWCTPSRTARILLCKNFLINLDELAVLSRQEINSLKSYFSKTQINERLPYERKNSIINRTCSFVGSSNMDEFLTDETGSVRWLCFRINSINWDYRAQIDINRVWAHAYALAQDKSFESEL